MKTPLKIIGRKRITISLKWGDRMCYGCERTVEVQDTQFNDSGMC